MALEVSEAARELVLEASQDPALGQLRVAPPSLSPVEIDRGAKAHSLDKALEGCATSGPDLDADPK